MDESPQTQPEPSMPAARSGVLCMSCGYDLIGVRIGEHCPECGTRIMQFGGNSNQTSGKAIASMVLGIVSLVTCGAYGIIGMPCAILALVYSKKAKRAIQAGTAPASSLGMANSGRVMGWIGVALNSIMLLFFVFYVIMMIGVFAGIAAGGGGPAPAPAPTPIGP